MKVPVTITQKVDGLQYEGTIKIGEKKFDWEICLGAPIPKILSQEVSVGGKEALRQLFNVTVKIGDKEVDITDDLFVFLMGTVVSLTLDFYQEPQTRDFNETMPDMVARYSLTPASCGMEMSYNIPEDRIPKALAC